MDFASITGVFSAIKAAKDLGAALIEARDFQQVAAMASELNRKLLEAQDGIFSVQAKMLELQTEHFQVVEELRKIKENSHQRRRYTLVEVSKGHFAYRLKDAEHRQEDIALHGDEPIHYLCQPCMDIRGSKSVLQRQWVFGAVTMNCPTCKTEVMTNERE